MNDLKELMRQNVASPPPDHLDIDALTSAGRRRVRHRRSALVAVPTVLATAAVAGAVLLGNGTGSDGAETAGRPPTPNAPTITLEDSTRAVEGRDYEVLASYTNKNLDRDNGQYFDGVTDDGLILFRDGPRADQLYPRLALMDPATGEKDWLPDLDVGQNSVSPAELGADRLVLLSGDEVAGDDAMQIRLVAHVFDRATREWSVIRWPALPALDFWGGQVGPDGRLYVKSPATQGAIPEGGWPMGTDGEAEDADAEGDTYRLWSVSLTDSADVRDEQLRVGDVALTDTSMVWTDSTNGDAGLVHVRDLASGEERSFDPESGERCNLLSFGATDDHVVMGQYCGTYDGGVRDDRVQVLTTDGDQEFTLQDSSVDGSVGPGGIVEVTSYDRESAGTYVYDLASGRFLRVSDKISQWALGGLVSDGLFMWHTPDGRHGATQWVGRLLGD